MVFVNKQNAGVRVCWLFFLKIQPMNELWMLNSKVFLFWCIRLLGVLLLVFSRCLFKWSNFWVKHSKRLIFKCWFFVRCLLHRLIDFFLAYKNLHTVKWTLCHNLNWSVETTRIITFSQRNTCEHILSFWHKDQSTEAQTISKLRTSFFRFFFITIDSQHQNGHNYGNCKKITASHCVRKMWL